MNSLRILLPLATIILAVATGASESRADSKGDAEVHRLKAQKYAEAKEWSQAVSEATKATDLDPTNREAWLVLGLSNQRLEKNAEAAAAYRKYLALNPPEEKAAAVREKLASVEVRNETQERHETTEKLRSYGPTSWALAVGYSPVHSPSVATELNAGSVPMIDIALHIGRVPFGFRWGSGDLSATVQAPQAGSTVSTAVYSNVALTSQKVSELYMGYNFNLYEPYQQLGPIQLFLPLRAGVLFNRVSNGTRDWRSGGLNLAVGLGAALYTKSPFGLELSALYHNTLSFQGYKEDSSPVLKSVSGTELSKSFSAFELKIAVKYMFGSAED